MLDRVPDPPSMSWGAACARRLDRQALATPVEDAQPADIVATLCGAHAQVMSAAKLSLGLRIASLTREVIQNALWTERSLVKTVGPRGTVHLLPARDLPMWTGALSALAQVPTGHAPDAQLTSAQTEAVVEAIAIALEDGELTVDELGASVIAQAGSWAGDLVMPAFGSMWPRWRQAISTAAHRGVLCFGENRGRLVTYTSPYRWLPDFRPAAGEAALAEIVRRYLYVYGPATPRDFAQWLGAPPRWATELFASLWGALQPVAIEGRRAWVATGDAAEATADARGVLLLPYFDAYVVGCQPRALLFPGRAAERALTPSGQAGNYPVLVVDGVVSGVWHLRRAGRRLAFAVEPFTPLDPAQRGALDDQVERIASFLGGRPELTIGMVTAGAHA